MVQNWQNGSLIQNGTNLHSDLQCTFDQDWQILRCSDTFFPRSRWHTEHCRHNRRSHIPGVRLHRYRVLCNYLMSRFPLAVTNKQIIVALIFPNLPSLIVDYLWLINQYFLSLLPLSPNKMKLSTGSPRCIFHSPRDSRSPSQRRIFFHLGPVPLDRDMFPGSCSHSWPTCFSQCKCRDNRNRSESIQSQQGS